MLLAFIRISLFQLCFRRVRVLTPSSHVKVLNLNILVKSVEQHIERIVGDAVHVMQITCLHVVWRVCAMRVEGGAARLYIRVFRELFSQDVVFFLKQLHFLPQAHILETSKIFITP